MAKIFQPDRRAGGEGGLQLFSDGNEMLVTFSNDLFRLKYPFVRSINVSHGMAYGSRYCDMAPEVEIEIVAGLDTMCRSCAIPDLTEFAERLTVEQLFQVIQKKLKARDDERPRAV